MNKMPSSKDLHENWFLKLEMNTKYTLILITINKFYI